VHELLLPQSLARAEALERCRRYLSTRYRGFRLAQLGLPRGEREDWIALLAWHGLAREIATAAGGFERRRGLDELGSEIEAALSERARSPVGVALSFAIRRHELPEELLRRPLLEWKRDESLATFETREALLAHARALAVPEGRLLLRLAGVASARNDVLIDALATALQLTAWLADFAGELARGRLRIAVDELAREGVAFATLLSVGSPRADPDRLRLARVVAGQVEWARSFYAKGWELCGALDPWRGRKLALVLRWHAATLSALEHRGFDALRGRPPSGWLRLLACGTASLATRSAPRLRAGRAGQ
jgi:phytoene/squalene synthetase